MEALASAYEFVQRQVEQKKAVVVHCWSGKDRTGLFLCYYLLVRHDAFTPEEAIARVRQVRPIALTATGWEDLARAVLRLARRP